MFYWHVGNGKFKDLSRRAGLGIATAMSSRGSAVGDLGDLDDDGSLEVVVSNMGARPSLLKNGGTHQHWLLLQLVGVSANKDAIGARVIVQAGGSRVSGEVQSGSSYISQNDGRVHLGLGKAASYERIEVIWPGGVRETFPGGKADRVVTVTQGTGSYADARRTK